MNKSAMLQALRLLGRKPMILLLIIPVSVLPVLNLVILPDITEFLDFSNLPGLSFDISGSAVSSLQMYNLVSTLISSVVTLFSLVSLFLLTPPAMELLADGAAGAETPAGWYMRGLRRHWWKPMVSGLVTGAVQAVLAIGLYIVFAVVLVVAILALGLGTSPMAGAVSDISAALPMIVALSVAFGLVIAAAMLVVSAVFALLLPALADRSFAEAFRLVFSGKGLRKLPKLLGGLLLIGLVPSAFYVALGAAYVLLSGIPGDWMGLLTTVLNYVKSWPGIFGYLLTAAFTVLPYAFQFCVYQQVKDEEARALIRQ